MSRGKNDSGGVEYPPGVQPFQPEMNQNELVKRLRVCAEALQKLDQLNGKKEIAKFRPLTQHLVQDGFLESNSKEVRILIACCIADVLRVFAPEAPYEEPDQQKVVMQFLAAQLKGLAQHDSPLFSRYFYLLENLVCVKSFTIALDLEDGSDLVWELCRICFSVIKPDHLPKVPSLMVDLIFPLLQEMDTIPTKVLDVIFTNIIEPRKTQEREANKLARDLIQRSENCLEPYIQANLNAMLLMGKQSESELAEHLYELIGELFSIVPTAIMAVLPQLEFKLKSNDEKERLDSLKLLGRLFSEQDSELATDCSHLWECFIGRFQDISPDVRSQAVKFCMDLLLYHPELKKDVIDVLVQRCRDVDDVVRTEAVLAIAGAYKKDLNVMDSILTDCLKDRTLDKKFKVRREALTSVGVLYRKVMINPASTPAAIQSVEWVKNKILHIYYQASLEDRLLSERLLNTCLVPYCMDTKKRMEMLFELYVSADENAMRAFNEIVRQQHNIRNVLRSILDVHKQEENSERETFILSKIKTLSEFFLDPQRSFVLFKDFYKFICEDSRAFKLLDFIVGGDYTCKKIEEFTKEMLVKLSSAKHQNLYGLVKALLERVSPLMIDSSAIIELSNILRRGLESELEIRGVSEEQAIERGLYLLILFSCSYGPAFKTQETLDTIVFMLAQGHILAGDSAIQILNNISSTLSLDDFPGIYDKILPELKNLAQHGVPRQSKHAVQCLFKIAPEKVQIFEEMLKNLKKRVSIDAIDIQTVFAGLSEIGRQCPIDFHTDLVKMLRSIVPNILIQHVDLNCSHSMEDWVPEDETSVSTKAKVAGIKFMARLLIGFKNLNDHVEWGMKCIKLLSTFIEAKGDLDGSLCNPEKARLRLAAGCALLKIAREKVYYDMIKLDNFQQLAYLIVDDCSQVREQFASKLYKGLIGVKLPLEFLSIYSLVPLLKLRNPSDRRILDYTRAVRNYVVNNVNRRRDLLKKNTAVQAKPHDFMPDYCLTYAVWLLSHHSMLKNHTNISALRQLKECLWFVMEPLTIQKFNEQYSFQFLYKMFQDMKQAKDALDPDNDDNNRKMWALCDLGMTLVSYRTHNFTLREHPAKTVLSRRFFTNLIRHENNTELYLPKEIIDEEKTKQSRAKKGKGNAAEPVDVSEVVNHEVEKQQKHAKSDQKPIVSGKRRKSSIKTPLQKKPVAKVLPRSSEVKIPKKSTRQSTKTKSGRILRGKKNMSEAEESASGSEDEVAESERDESDDDKPIASISPKKSGGPSPKKPLKRLALTSSSSSSEMKSIGSGVAKRSSDPSGISTSYTSKLRKRKSEPDGEPTAPSKVQKIEEEKWKANNSASPSKKFPTKAVAVAESPARGRASQAQHKVVLRQSAVRKSPRKATASETLKSPTTGRASNRIIGKGSVSSPGMEEEGESDFEESMEEEEHNTSPVKKRKASNAQFQIEREQTSESGTDEEENGEEKENSGGAASEAKVRHPTGMVDDLFDDAPEEDEEMEEEMLAEPNQSDRRITRSSPGSALRKSVGRKELKGAELIASRIAKVQKTIAQGEIELEDEENDEVPSPTSTRRGAVRNLAAELDKKTPKRANVQRRASNLQRGVRDHLS